MATVEDFNKLDIRVGRIIEVEDFPEANKPSYKIKVDFGVKCVVNFPPKRIGSATSDVLILGVPDENDNCILIQPEKEVDIGGKLY